MKSLVEWSKDLAVSTDPLRTCNCLPFFKSFTEEAEKDEPTEAASSAPNIDAQSPPPADVDFAEPSGDNDVETFKKQKALKATMEEGRSRFNQNPKKCIFPPLPLFRQFFPGYCLFCKSRKTGRHT